MAALFDTCAAHLELNDHIPLLNEGVVEVAAVHACIAGGADRTCRRRKPIDLVEHELVCDLGEVNTLSGLIFEDKGVKHRLHLLDFFGVDSV